jgi:hypothetical protein
MRQQIESGASGDQIELEFGVMMHRVGAAELSIVPQVSLQSRGQFELLAHATRNDNKSPEK